MVNASQPINKVRDIVFGMFFCLIGTAGFIYLITCWDNLLYQMPEIGERVTIIVFVFVSLVGIIFGLTLLFKKTNNKKSSAE